MKTKKLLLHFKTWLSIYSLIVMVILNSCKKEEVNEINYLKTPDTLISKKMIYDRDNPLHLESSTEYFYNNSGKLIKSLSNYGNDSQPEYYDTLQYENNQLMKRISFHYNNQLKIWEKSGTETHTYSDASTEIIQLTIEPTQYSNTTIITRNQNLITKEEIYNNEFLYQTTLFTYNNGKLESKKNYYSPDLELTSCTTYTYFLNYIIIKTYDRDNQLSDETTEFYQNSRLQSVYFKSYTWDTEKLIKKLKYDEYGRISEEMIDPVYLPYMSFLPSAKIVVYQY